jgi:hypothetical protein
MGAGAARTEMRMAVALRRRIASTSVKPMRLAYVSLHALWLSGVLRHMRHRPCQAHRAACPSPAQHVLRVSVQRQPRVRTGRGGA